MSASRPLNLFYEEPDPDRWIPFDRYPRRLVRRLVRGPFQPGGTMRVFLNLQAGLDKIGVPYRTNDFNHIRRHPDQLACVIGKPQVLDKIPQETPVLFGTSIFNHPIDDPDLPMRRPIRQVLVPSPWVRDMFTEVWPGRVSVWPVGIDTDLWCPDNSVTRDIDVLVYDKIFQQRDRLLCELVEPLLAELRRRGLRTATLRYGSYREEELYDYRRRCRSAIYLSRHETQGIAAKQLLSSGVPMFVWDAGGMWQDPKYVPHLVQFGPVSSMPYWDDRCGVKFKGASDMVAAFDRFWKGVETGSFEPRALMVERFGLADRARAYVELADKYA